jgi:hypothetical protein
MPSESTVPNTCRTLGTPIFGFRYSPRVFKGSTNLVCPNRGLAGDGNIQPKRLVTGGSYVTR